ncbi:beta-galactosidase [Glycomyces rhizosphaerae]|uniref:Beta-galactosidase n=1 Tax=Glycomyces rhizosphaerae TaxID=2054422 RepID=A0ABV7Q1I8_9ACTN
MNPEITVKARWIERAGRPWFPVSGEIHFSRLPRGRWSEVLGHARAGGVDAVATYVFWNAHEPEPGQFRWEGNRDLRAFVELAAEHGLGVVVRLGPWAHGESRYGGFPDWLVARGLPVRTNDPAYLELVRAFYAETIAQLTGLAHHEGGPIVAAQVDNELYDRPEHLAALRDLAEELGLDVPIWTATGWGGAQVPDSLLPVYGAYVDGFWDDSETEWPSFGPVHFRYSEVRDDLTVGADLREALDGVEAGTARARPELPFATCELGGGMHVAYHRRPLVAPEDVAALALAKIGSGSVWQGYYMYAGGTQRVGQRGTEQESQATGYPNDVPALSYDFHAPIGEHGQIRAHHHLLRRQHLWLREEGHRIATMTTTIGGGSDDPEELRWAVRSDGHSGYLFLTTYQPAKRPLAAQPGVQLHVEFDDGTVTVPSRPVDLPSGVSVAWPLHYRLTPDLELRSATAQLVTRISDDAGELVVLAAHDNVPVELVVDGVDGVKVIEPDTAPGPACVIDLPGVRVLILDEPAANRLYRLPVAGRDRLVLSDAPVYIEGGDLVLHPDTSRSTIAMLPPVTLSGAGEPRDEGLWRTWEVAAPDAGTRIIAADLRPEHGPPPPPRRGGPMDRLSAPVDYSGAARLRVDVPDSAFAADRTLLRVTWTGDTGRAFAGGALIGDHFWHGRAWDLDLTPHAAAIAVHGLTLELLPWRRATGVWVDPSVRDLPDGITVDAITAVNVAKIRLRPEPA